MTVLYYVGIACNYGPEWHSNNNTRPPLLSNRMLRHRLRHSQASRPDSAHTISLLQQTRAAAVHQPSPLSSAANIIPSRLPYTPLPPPRPNLALRPLPRHQHRRQHRNKRRLHPWPHKRSCNVSVAHSGRPFPAPLPLRHIQFLALVARVRRPACRHGMRIRFDAC